MAAIYQRRLTWWIRFYHPTTGRLIRESLGTSEQARAELLRQRVELEAALLALKFKSAELPVSVLAALGHEASMNNGPAEAIAAPEPVVELPKAETSKPERTSLDAALKAYVDFIRADNAVRHVDNKLSILHRFLGTQRVEPYVVSDNSKYQQLRLQKAVKGFSKVITLTKSPRRYCRSFSKNWM